MKRNFKWIAAVVFALVLGYFGGKSSLSEVAVKEKAGHSARAETIHRGDGERGAQRKHRAGSRSGAAGRETRVINLIIQEAQFSSDDPFSSYAGESWPRLCAWILNAPRSEFPDIMDLGKDERVEMGYDGNFVKVVMQRWVELDPDSAMQWWKEHGEKNGEPDFPGRAFLLQEALLFHPDWAIDQMKILQQEVKAFQAKGGEVNDDPFGDGQSFDISLFVRRLAAFPARQRKALRSRLASDVTNTDKRAWIEGLVIASSRGDQSGLEAALRGIETEYEDESGTDGDWIRSVAIQQIAMTDWRRARDLLDRTGGSSSAEMEVWGKWRSLEPVKADGWYLARSGDSGERGRRISALAATIEDLNQRRVWIDQMEQAGESVEGAWSDIIGKMSSSGRVDDAMALIEKISEEKRLRKTEEIFSSRSHNYSLYGTEGSVEYVVPREESKAFAAQYPEYRKYVITKNREALRRLSTLLETVEDDLGEDAP